MSSSSNSSDAPPERELARSRKLLTQIEDDVIKLRMRIAELEKEVATRKKVKHKDGVDIGVQCRDDDEDYDSDLHCDWLLSPGHPGDLQDRYDVLKDRLSVQADELKSYRDKVLRLQDKLIEKNEIEKKLLQKNPSKQLACSFDIDKQLELKVAKVRSLEEAYRKQEKVIEKMEILMKMQGMSKIKKTEKRVSELEAENEMLRKQLMTEKRFPTNIPSLHQPQHRVSFSHQPQVAGDPYLEIIMWREKYEKAEAKIKELEKQVVENNSTWAVEKAELLMKLKKHKKKIPEKLYRHDLKSCRPCHHYCYNYNDSQRHDPSYYSNEPQPLASHYTQRHPPSPRYDHMQRQIAQQQPFYNQLYR